MTTYTLSIEDLAREEGKVTKRAVYIAVDGNLLFDGLYNPNAKSKKPFNSQDHEFNTSFSIVHPFRKVAKRMVDHYFRNGVVEAPKLKYDSSVNDAQQRLFENILTQEYEKAKEGEQKLPRRASLQLGKEHEIGIIGMNEVWF